MTVTRTDGMRQMKTIQEGLIPAYDRGRDVWNTTDEHCSGSGYLLLMIMT